MTQVKTQKNQEESNDLPTPLPLKIQSTYTQAVTNLSAGVSIYAEGEQRLMMFGEWRVLDQVKIYNKWVAGEQIPKPNIEVHSYKATHNGYKDGTFRVNDYDERFFYIGLTPELIAEGIAKYYEKAQEAVEGINS